MDTVETHKLSQANNEAVCFDLFEPDVHGIKRTVRMFMLNGYKHLRFYLKEEKKSPNKYMYILTLNMIIVLCPEEDRINSA